MKKILKQDSLNQRVRMAIDSLPEQQRVAIARALVNEPDIILADEPIGNLDTATGIGIMQLLQRINRGKGKTILCVTHSKEAAEYSQKIIHVRDGIIHD